jgi:basic amino acid/polyamine antiporter, APA family
MSKKGVPAYGIIASTVLASIAMAINYMGSGGATVFTTLVLMTGITAAIPYGFSALAQLKWRWIDHKTMETPRFARDMTVAILSLVFAILFIWYSRGTPGTVSGSTGRRSSWPAGRCCSVSRSTWRSAVT